MAQIHDHEDKLLDANLKRIGASVRLPAPPTDAQKSFWIMTSSAKRAAEVVQFPKSSSRGARLMRNPRFLTLAGSAAASAAIGGFLWLSASQNMVHASAILSSFRERIFQGFHLTIRDVGEEGVRVNGEIHARFAPFDLANPPAPEAVDVIAAAMDLRVIAEESAADIGGLNLHIAAAGDDASQWAFIQAEKVPSEWIDEDPMAAAALQFMSNGLLLELDGVLDMIADSAPEILGDLDFFDGGEADAAGTQAAGPDPSIKISITSGDQPDDARSSVAVKRTVEIDWKNPDQAQLEQFAQDFLLGRAGPEHIDAIAELIQQAARDVKVVEIEPGVFMLRASDFSVAVAEDDGDVEMLKRMIVEITYRRDYGVESARIANLGEYNGEIRLSFADEPIHPALLDRERFLEAGGVTVLNLAALKPMIEAALHSSDE